MSTENVKKNKYLERLKIFNFEINLTIWVES